MSTAEQAHELYRLGRLAEAVELATSIPRSKPGFAAGRVVAVRALIEQGDQLAATALLDTTVDDQTDDGAILRLWRLYIRALALPDGAADLARAVTGIDQARRDGRTARVHAEATSFAAMLTQLRVVYADLPHAALRTAADLSAQAAHDFRALDLPGDEASALVRHCRILREINGATAADVAALLAPVVAQPDPPAQAAARLEVLDARTEETLNARSPSWPLDAIAAECDAIGRLLEAAGHACGPAQAAWTVLARFLRHGIEAAVEDAHVCAEAFILAGAVQRANEVWQALERYHGLRGERELQQAAAAQVAGTRWEHFTFPGKVAESERLLRTGQIGQARAATAEHLLAAPHRAGRVGLRVMLASQAMSVGLDDEARMLLTDALADLEPVAPSTLSGEVLALLAALGIGDIASAADAASAVGDVLGAARYLAMNAQLRAQTRRAAGVSAAASDPDLDRAAELLTQDQSLEGARALLAVEQARGQTAFLGGRPQAALEAFERAADVARSRGLRFDLGFVLSYAGMVATQLARDHGLVDVYDAAAAMLDEAHDHFVATELTQFAWRPAFMAANAVWEASRRDPDPTSAAARLDRAERSLEQVSTELDRLRGATGGGDAVERQLVGIGFGIDKQQVYKAGLRLQLDGRRDTAAAVRWLERMKSRSLLDAVSTPDDDVVATLRPSTSPPSWDTVRSVLRAQRERTGRRVLVAQYYCDADTVLLFGMADDLDAPLLANHLMRPDELARFARSTFRTSGGVRMLSQDSADGGIGTWHRFADLVAPLQDWAGPDDVVHLIPHHTLTDLPLHTLPVDGTPLGLRNPVVYSPSLALLTHVLTRPPARQTADAVFGDPRGNLPWAADEARAVAATLGTTPTLGDDVTRAAVLAALRSARTVHIAAHARASIDDGLTSGVQLAAGDVLRARELLSAAVDVDLVALSGCETGVSEHRPGDENVGLVRALLHSGARAMLTSQWRVNDRSAQRLLTAFHTADRDQHRADALRTAMRAVAAEPGLGHFYHWGGFVLVGDWR